MNVLRIDNLCVVPDREAKSSSHETTFTTDITDREVLCAWLLELAEQVSARLRRKRLRGRTIDIKVRCSDFRTITRAHTLSRTTDITQDIWDAAASMLDE